MLVRRVLRHWHAQNWAGVALDLLVVIAGILIGLRIDAWRDEVQDREDEVAYLERLLVDAEANAESLDAVLERMWYRREQGRGALARLLAGDPLSPDEQARTVEALVAAGELPKPALFHGTFGELVATGRMPIIEDETLRTLLQRQMGIHDQVAGRAEIYRAALLDAQPTTDRHAILAGVAGSDGVVLQKRYDLDALRSDSRAHVVFHNQIEASEDFSAEREAERDAVIAVRDRLRCRLGKPSCPDRRTSLDEVRAGD